jgi:hypothetical protein
MVPPIWKLTYVYLTSKEDFWLPTRLINPLHDSYLGVHGWPSVPCVAKLPEANSSPVTVKKAGQTQSLVLPGVR